MINVQTHKINPVQEFKLDEAVDNNSILKLSQCQVDTEATELSQASELQLQESDKVYKWLRPTQINLTAGTQSRLKLDLKAIERYQEDMVEGHWNYKESPPIIFFDGYNYYPGDGHHRIKSAEFAQVEIYCEVRRGTLINAIRYSCSANQRPSLHRTNGDKRRAVELMYKTLIEEYGSLDAIPQSQGGSRKEQDWSIRRIAEYVGVGKSLVSDVRAQLELTVLIGQFKEGDHVEVICPKRYKPHKEIKTGTLGIVLGTNKKRGVYVNWDTYPSSYIHPDRLKYNDKPLIKTPEPAVQNHRFPNSVRKTFQSVDQKTTTANSNFSKTQVENDYQSIEREISTEAKSLGLLTNNNHGFPKMSETDNHQEQTKKAVEQLLYALECPLTGTCLDCCAGEGTIAKALAEKSRLRVITNDINPDLSMDYHQDASIQLGWQRLPDADWIISTPPYTKASTIIPLAYEKVKKGIIMLLKLSYLEPCQDRVEWLTEHPPTKLICIPAILSDLSAKKRDLDSIACAWFVWLKDPSIKTRQPFTFIKGSNARGIGDGSN